MEMDGNAMEMGGIRGLNPKKQVAIKQVAKEHCQQLEQLRTEIKVLSSLDHPRQRLDRLKSIDSKSLREAIWGDLGLVLGCCTSSKPSRTLRWAEHRRFRMSIDEKR